MMILSEHLKNLGLEGKTIGYDVDGYGYIFDYRGPRLKSSKMLSMFMPGIYN